MKRKTVVVILIVLVCLGLVWVYKSPEENHKYKADLHGTIEVGRWFSWLLFIGNKYSLLEQFDFTDEARSKLKKADIQQVFWKDILDKYNAGGGKYAGELKSMLFKEPDDIELVALERQQSFLAMTFTLNGCPIVPGKGKMLCSIVFRYYQPVNGSLWKRILRKTANAVPFCSSFGTTGRWLVVDYSYTYNQSDYAAWYLREGDALSSQKQEETRGFWKKMEKKEGFQELMRGFEMDLAMLEVWATLWVERHPEHIDELVFQAGKKVRDEIGAKAR